MFDCSGLYGAHGPMFNFSETSTKIIWIYVIHAFPAVFHMTGTDKQDRFTYHHTSDTL